MMELSELFFWHIAVTLAWLLWRCRSDRIQATSEAVIVLALPGFGILLMAGYRLACLVFRLEERKPGDDGSEEDGTSGYDGNIVPINDTFLLEDAKKKREFFTTAIKQDMVTNQEILRMAMSDSDRETAFYAVSLLTRKMENLESQILRKEGMLRKMHEAEDVGALEKYAGLLKEYLSHRRFVDHVTFRQKRQIYLGVLDRLVSLVPDKKEYYVEELRELISEGDYKAADEVCRSFQERFPEDEDSYLMYIRLYQAMHEPGKLQEKIAALKECPIRLSGEALRVIRYWDKGARHG